MDWAELAKDRGEPEGGFEWAHEGWSGDCASSCFFSQQVDMHYLRASPGLDWQVCRADLSLGTQWVALVPQLKKTGTFERDILPCVIDQCPI